MKDAFQLYHGKCRIECFLENDHWLYKSLDKAFLESLESEAITTAWWTCNLPDGGNSTGFKTKSDCM